ncbi:MAG TPA: 16S rRNA (uracil(1498)-N(3))-methyltransferase [Candidatus Dorea intestinavium]|nr:16S rRNA (uracil(1498)-N(3))-methyltransferase [Candidatus Dorea intestinavium]
MQLFFVDKEAVKEDFVHISGRDVNHIRNVLRMKEGEEVMVSDETSFYLSTIKEISKEEVLLKVKEQKEIDTELPASLYLFQGLPKKDKMDFIIMKTVELGVHTIVPVATKRAVVKLDEKKADKKLIRWQQIAETAAKQSKRGRIPKVNEVLSFKEALLMAKDLDVILCPYEEAKGMNYTKEVLGQLEKGCRIGIFIGPEGGFAQSEVAELQEAGAKVITLGKRILRTETAGMFVLSVLSYLLES